MSINRDQNYVVVAGGWDGTQALPLRVDPVTNELLFLSVSTSSPSTAMTMVKRDENYKPTYYGVLDTDGVTLVPIRTDPSGYLLTT